jgi:ribosomal protein S18 acetylase RimI-like enzyme
LKDSDRVLGGYIGVSGRDLRSCRKSDFMAFINQCRTKPREDVTARLRASANLLSTVADDEFYLSRIGVAAASRGGGMGRRLLDAFLSEGREKQFAKFRLDVAANNERAIALYRAAGFEVASQSGIPDSAISYCSMTLKV